MTGRNVADLPKAHLHLHFTGSMRPSTLQDLAARHGVHLPLALTSDHPPHLMATDDKGWFRFQRLYDIARSCVRDQADIQRLVLEAAQDDVADGSRWLELQVDPTSYAPSLGGLTSAMEVICAAAAAATAATGLHISLVIAASRIRHPLDARTLARLAVRFAGDGPGQVVGFGLSNDERRGVTSEFGAAFAIAARAGLASLPHGGELLGPDHVQQALTHLAPDRLGHGVRSAEDPRVLGAIIARGITLEVCPASNVALGVYAEPAQVPIRRLLQAGAQVALGADDPLLFGARLADQYQLVRDIHGLTDPELADLARMSITGSRAPEGVKRRLQADVTTWLTPPAATAPIAPTPTGTLG